MKTTINILLLLLSTWVNAQFSYTTINTGTGKAIHSINHTGNKAYVHSMGRFMGEIYDGTDTLKELPTPDSTGYFQHFVNVIDTSNIFMLMENSSTFRYIIYQSRDGSKTWSPVFDTTNYRVYTLAMLDTMNGVIGGAWGQTCRTYDGGKNWICQSIPGLDYASNAGTINDSIIWLMMGNYSRFSYDTGKTWKIDGIAGKDTKKFLYLNKDTLYDLSNDVGDCRAFFTRTYDGGGFNWHQWMFDKDPILEDMEFITNKHGYVVGKDCATSEALMYRTLDEGTTWERMYTGLTWGFLDMEFINDSIALIGGEGGNLIKWNIHNFVNNTVSIAEINTKAHEINVAPNPSRTQFTITSRDLSGPYQLQVLNMLGDAVISRNGQFKGTLHLKHNLPSGVYLITLQVGEDRFSRKIVVDSN